MKRSINIEETIDCLNEIIEENEWELGSDNDSEYAKKYLRYNLYLKKAVFMLEEKIDPTHGHAE